MAFGGQARTAPARPAPKGRAARLEPPLEAFTIGPQLGGGPDAMAVEVPGGNGEGEVKTNGHLGGGGGQRQQSLGGLGVV